MVSTAAFHARVRGSVPGLPKQKLFLPHPRVKVSNVGSLRDREVACSALDRQGSNFESCVWGTVSSQSSHHPREVLLPQFSLYVHKGGLKPDSFHFTWSWNWPFDQIDLIDEDHLKSPKCYQKTIFQSKSHEKEVLHLFLVSFVRNHIFDHLTLKLTQWHWNYLLSSK